MFRDDLVGRNIVYMNQTAPADSASVIKLIIRNFVIVYYFSVFHHIEFCCVILAHM
jgi:hypothetical protein